MKNIIGFGSRFIDYKMGLYGAIAMGTIVFVINYYGILDLQTATTAALKQAVYTFMFGGLIMRGCELLATHIGKKALALAVAVLVPSLISIGLTYGVHSLKGTPKPIESTIPTAILVIPSTAVWGFMKRKEMGKNKIEQE